MVPQPLFMRRDRKILECFFWLPHRPDFAHQGRTGFEGGFAGLPTGRSHLAGGADVLKCLYLPQEFSYIATNFWRQYFHCPNVEIGIDQESSADIHAGIFFIYAVDAADPPARIGEQREGYTAFDHLTQFFFLPDFVGEPAVGADGEKLNTQSLKFAVFDGNCRQFRRSDKGKITRVEADDNPLSLIIG